MEDKIYTKYDLKTGEIISIFTGTDDDAKLNGPCIEGNYFSDEYRIINGKPVKKNIAEINEVKLKKAWADLREERNNLLAGSDYTQLPDAAVNKEAWKLYRKSLRDLPSNTKDPLNPVWPEEPN
jgi:hypothetical protein